MYSKMVASIIGLVSLFVSLEARASEDAFDPNNEAYRFVVFAVLEGAYSKGLNRRDMMVILEPSLQVRSEGLAVPGYKNFIPRCPVCDATLQGFLLYDARPPIIKRKKTPGPDYGNSNRTFGSGLSDQEKLLLYSDDPAQRLNFMHALVSTWIQNRMDQMHLSQEERSYLLGTIANGREEGMKELKKLKDRGTLLEATLPGYVDIDSCAMCDAACLLPFNNAPSEDESEPSEEGN